MAELNMYHVLFLVFFFFFHRIHFPFSYLLMVSQTLFGNWHIEITDILYILADHPVAMADLLASYGEKLTWQAVGY